MRKAHSNVVIDESRRPPGVGKLTDKQLDHVAFGKADDSVAAAACFPDVACVFAESFGQRAANLRLGLSGCNDGNLEARRPAKAISRHDGQRRLRDAAFSHAQARSAMGKLWDSRRPRLLAVASSQPPLSLARVAGGILHSVAADFEVHQFALGYTGDPHGYPWDLYPAARPNDPYGFTGIQELVGRLKPDLVFFMTELVLVAEFLKRMGGDEPPLLAYFPVDAWPIPASTQGRSGDSRESFFVPSSVAMSQSKRWHCIGRTAIRRHDCQTFN
jgi:hypothetical protein